MIQTFVSFDLDWLNDVEKPVDFLTHEILPLIPLDVPVSIVIEHHQLLGKLRKWIKAGMVPTPFEVLNVDEHHDYYFQTDLDNPIQNPRQCNKHCGNWGFHMPFRWYYSYVWVTNYITYMDDWEKACNWLLKKGISTSDIGKHDLNNPNRKILAAIFVVSPDYLGDTMLECAQEAVDTIANHFSLRKAPILRKKDDPDMVGEVKSWRVSPRPVLIC